MSKRRFSRFQQGAVKDYNAKFNEFPQMNHVEAAVMDRVARLYSEIFTRLSAYCEKKFQLISMTLLTILIEKYNSTSHILTIIAPVRRAGLNFCYPTLSSNEQRALRA